MPNEHLFQSLGLTTLFAFLGLLVFAAIFKVIQSVTPFSIRKEIEDDQNVALAIVIGSVFIGTALIISAAIHG